MAGVSATRCPKCPEGDARAHLVLCIGARRSYDGCAQYKIRPSCYFMIWWGLKFIVTPLETNYTDESFFHLINLPFHEAGHVIFTPFGRFMTILGGTLGQILMPIVCLGTFLVKTRDPFGAAVALWWTAESLMDIAPYINDARALDLMLIGGVTGKETDEHDWNNILTMLDLLEWDHWLAHLTNNVGILLMLGSIVWGGIVLLRHHRPFVGLAHITSPPLNIGSAHCQRFFFWTASISVELTPI